MASLMLITKSRQTGFYTHARTSKTTAVTSNMSFHTKMSLQHILAQDNLIFEVPIISAIWAHKSGSALIQHANPTDKDTDFKKK